MRVCLIDPSNYPVLKLGLTYILTSIEMNGHKPFLIDLAFKPNGYVKYVIKEIKKRKPDVIGFSSMTIDYAKSLNIAKAIKEIFPDLPIIFGGPHVTSLPEESIRNQFIDYICIGEGEKSFVEFLDNLEKGKEPRVPGIWAKKNGKIIKNPLRPYTENLDELPFPNWGYWNLKKYFRANFLIKSVLPVLASRGCPYRCSFCASGVFSKLPGKYYRVRSAKNVIEEIKELKKYKKKGLEAIQFQDDTFGLNKRQFDEFTKLYVREKLNEELPWMCFTRADVITRDWARKASRAGCIFVGLGLETGNEKIRCELYNKRITNKQFKDAASNLKRYGIPYSFSVMIGGPYDGKKEILESIRFMEELGPTLLDHICIFTPLPMTELEKVCKRNKLFVSKYRDYSNGLPIVKTKKLEPGQLKSLLFKIKIQRIKNDIQITASRIGYARLFKEFFRTILSKERSISMSHPMFFRWLFINTIVKPYMKEVWKDQVILIRSLKE